MKLQQYPFPCCGPMRWPGKKVKFGLKESDVLSAEKGTKNENLVEDYIKNLAGQGKVATYFKLDTNGNDFLVIKLDGTVQPIQVKSSQAGIEKHTAKWPAIPAVMINPDYNWRTVIRGILSKEYYGDLKHLDATA